MQDIISERNIPLLDGIEVQDRKHMLDCIGYQIRSFRRGEIIAFEGENIKHVGVVLHGGVDMIKEDLWGDKTILMRMGKGALFGESFACGSDSLSVVTFQTSEDARVLFLSFGRVMHSCSMSCEFHRRLTENMVRLIADKNRDLLRKVEILSKRTIREKLLVYFSIQSQLQGTRYFEIPLGRMELAEYLCVDRSALTRELASMKKDGLIDYHKNCFRIL